MSIVDRAPLIEYRIDLVAGVQLLTHTKEKILR